MLKMIFFGSLDQEVMVAFQNEKSWLSPVLESRIQKHGIAYGFVQEEATNVCVIPPLLIDEQKKTSFELHHAFEHEKDLDFVDMLKQGVYEIWFCRLFFQG